MSAPRIIPLDKSKYQNSMRQSSDVYRNFNTHDKIKDVYQKRLTSEHEIDTSNFKLNTEVFIKDKIEEFQNKNLEELNLENLSVEDKHISLLT